MKFSVPVQTQSILTETSTSAIFSKVVNEPVHNKDMKKTEEKLFERRSKLKELTEKNKQRENMSVCWANKKLPQ